MARNTDKGNHVKNSTCNPRDALFMSSVLVSYLKDLKVQCLYEKLLQWLLLRRTGLLSHETRVTTCSSSPRAANQELGINTSECQTSSAPSKRGRTNPHYSSNDVLCWTPQLFEYCTQVHTERCDGPRWSCGQGHSFPSGR